jgi:putative nucleotidyltransferase with HDIG domain
MEDEGALAGITAQELAATLAAQAVTGRRALEAAHAGTLRRLLALAGYRDDNTYEHTQRVGELAAQLAEALRVPPEEVALIRAGAPLHDIGKVAIPDSILLKPGSLTPEEFEVVKTHAALGARVLEDDATEALATAAAIARHHHERWDGRGYPDGLAGQEIPLAARIVHVADVFDVLVHERPYRESFSVAAALEEIERGSGSQFDPQAVRVFSGLL